MRRMVLAVALVLLLGVPLSAAASSPTRTGMVTGAPDRAIMHVPFRQAVSFQGYAVFLLPDVTQLPFGFIQQDNFMRSLTQEAAQFADTNAAQLLAAWGWQANAYRIFARSGGVTTFLDVSVNLFTTETTAAAASEYFVAHDQAANPSWSVLPTGPRYVSVRGFPKLVSSVLLSGPDASGGIGADLFMEIGLVTIRIGGIALATSPVSDMTAVAYAFIQKYALMPV